MEKIKNHEYRKVINFTANFTLGIGQMCFHFPGTGKFVVTILIEIVNSIGPYLLNASQNVLFGTDIDDFVNWLELCWSIE